ncbi:uncharacterized protein KQ657_005148 [Scheffersomyces spartinae]|uniref:Secretory component protein SHR3 n=1 Tax=Scheffersomyces spartinae TaxID=45513 RepID=A0A9P8AIK9_9ASCO|nr:uncharacterized protein KQ657_005148 [Scheffersomyces spartinae]KAG7193949.1 hypothetical protein KQ657_005148 [Scheffersomyces spartinae]
MMGYKEIVPIGTGLILFASGFSLGIIYGQWPWDLNTLWRYDETGAAFEKTLAMYKVWNESPLYVHYLLHFVFVLGLIGHFIKLYKPTDDTMYFHYGSLGLFVLAIVIYLTNLRIGLQSVDHGDWGEVDYQTGLNVMAASKMMIVVILVGVLFLQGGLYYATWYDAELKREFLEREAALEAAELQKQLAAEGKDSEITIEPEQVEISTKKSTTASGSKSKKGKKRKE